ncbi:SdpI family protein [bacterium]|nr:SdpI family protein [bacterium]
MKAQYRVNKEVISKEWALIVLIIFLFLLGLLVYPRLPEKVPSHWNFKGEVDRYSSRFWGAFGIPIMIALMYLGLLYIPYVDPKRENYLKFESTYRIIRALIVIVFACLQIVLLIVVLSGKDYLVSKMVPGLIGVMLILIGNYLPRIKYNWFVGIRTPWTLSNEEVWKRTHRVSGYLFVLGGILMLSAVFLPPPVNITVGLGGVILVSLLSIVYSYYLFKRVTKN